MSVLDMFLAVIMLFIISIVIIFSHVLVTEFQTQTEDLFPDAAQNITDTGITAVLNFDWGFVFLIGGVFMSIIIGAFLIPTHPVFVIASLLIMAVFLLIAPQFSNMFDEVMLDTRIAPSASSFVLVDAVWASLPFISLAFIALLIIVTYAKTRSGQIGI